MATLDEILKRADAHVAAKAQALPKVVETTEAATTATPQEPSTARQVGNVVGGFAQGAADVVNPAAIPRGIETMGRAVGKAIAHPIETIKHPINALVDAEKDSVIPAPSIGDQAAGVRSLIEAALNPGSDYLGNLEQNQSVQKEYEGGLNSAARTTGQVAAIVPGLIAAAKTIVKGSTKLASKIPGLLGKVEEAVGNAGIRAGTGERIVQQGVANAEKLSQFKTVGDTYIYDKAQNLGKLVENYRDFRNANYEAAIQPLLKEHGAVEIPVDDIYYAISDTLDEADSLSGKLVKHLQGLTESLRDKPALSFAEANEMKKGLMNKFGSFSKKNYVGQTTDDAIAARNIGFKLIDAINQAVPDIIPINKDYKDASNLIEDLNHIIGPKNKLGIFEKAQPNISTSMSKGKEALAVILDNFSKAYGKATPVIEDFRNFIAAKAIQGGAQPGLSAIATNRGLYGRASGALQFFKDQPFERGLDLLSAMKSTKPVVKGTDLATIAAGAGSAGNVKRKE